MASPISEGLGFAVRPIHPSDAAVLRQQIRDVRRADRDPRLNPAEIVRLLTAHAAMLPSHSHTVVAPDGTPCAVAMLVPGRRMPRGESWLILGAVHPAYRRRGIGAYLIEWALGRGREIAASRPRGVTFSVQADCREGVAGQRELFTRYGFAPVREFCYLQRDLTRPIACAPPPAGIALVPWHEELDAHVRDVSNATFSQHWAARAAGADEWRAAVSGNPRFRGDLSVVALDDGAVAGYALACVDVDDEDDHRLGWVTQVGVTDRWRLKGLATTLMTSVLERFRQEGLPRVLSSADAADGAHGVRLCLKVGYEIEGRYTRFGIDLATGGAA